MDTQSAQKLVREAYGKIAQGQTGSGCCTCCGPDTRAFAQSLGYSEEELSVIPDEANLALGCGNPTALASLQEGEVVLDLGAGAGFDCFLAAAKVGQRGKVIGVDMTSEMVERARGHAKQHGVANVEFRLGEIEHLPVGDHSVDVVISNCVINLSADKPQVFQEVKRVLKPDGRMAIADIALRKELPATIRESIEAYTGCIAGALLVEEYQKIVEASGLKGIRITMKDIQVPDTLDPLGRAVVDSLGENESIEEYVVSMYVEGRA